MAVDMKRILEFILLPVPSFKSNIALRDTHVFLECVNDRVVFRIKQVINYYSILERCDATHSTGYTSGS